MSLITLTRTIADTTEACADSAWRAVIADNYPADLDRLDRGLTIVAVTATDWVPDWAPGYLECTWLDLLPVCQAPLWYLTTRVPM